MAIELYPHNQKTYEKMTEMFKANNRVGVVQPTGTGKSFLYLKWMEEHPQDRFAVLSPSTEIFTQLQEYAESSGAPELLDSVQMISYQALLRMSDEEVQVIHPDKMVLDEFHRTGAEQWGPALQRLLDANPQAQVLGASATPVRYLDDGKDMASELFDRNLAVEMTLGEAVRRGILPTPKYVPVWYDIDGKLARYENDISKISNKEERKDLEEKLDQLKRRLESSYGAEDIFQKHMPHDHSKFLVFCGDSIHLEEMKKTVPQWLKPVNQNVRCYVSISAQEDKDLQLQAFKEDNGDDAVKLLFTIDRLNEGLHVKGIDGVMMLRPTISPIIYLQQMGRALASGGKNPLIFDLVNNYQSVQVPMSNGVNRNVFEFEFRNGVGSVKEVGNFRIFEDMMEFTSLIEDFENKFYFYKDEIWNQHFNLLQRFVVENSRLPKKRESFEGFKLGVWTDYQKSAAKKAGYPHDRLIKLQRVGLMEDWYEVNWNRCMNVLTQFVETHKRLPYFREEYQGIKLGVWCASQKRAFKNNNLNHEKIIKLTNIGVLDVSTVTSLDEKLALLEQFFNEFDRLPYNQEVYQSFNLGAWYSSLSFHRKSFSPVQFERLKAIELASNKSDRMMSSDQKWNTHFLLLQKFIDQFSRFPQKNEVYEGIKLGSWCDTQKSYARALKLLPERFEKLKAIGLLDDLWDKRWEKNFVLLEKFIEEYSRFPKHREVYKGVKLGIWCSAQRQAAKASRLSSERFENLKAIGLLQSNGESSIRSSLDSLIQSASSRVVDSSTDKSPAKEYTSER